MGFTKTAESKCVKKAVLKVNPEKSYLGDGLYITGITSDNCSKLTVKAHNHFADLQGGPVLNYKIGDSKFNYEISEKLNNVAVGMNCYFFIAECDGGQKVMDMVMLEFKKE